MKMLSNLFRLPAIAAICLFLLPASAQEERISLISGTEGMDNFTVVGDANWSTDTSSVWADEGSGASWLVTRDSYGDFVLHVEFWASQDANSGIYLRCQDRDNITDRNCYEANIFDQRPDPSFGTGAIVHIASVDEPRPTVGDRWNVFHITLRGDHLVVQLNNETTVDVRDSQFAEGPIALQWGRGTIRFRNVWVAPLD